MKMNRNNKQFADRRMEMEFKKRNEEKNLYYATLVDAAVAPEQDTIGDDGILAYEKTECFYDKISINITVNKK